MKVIYRIEASAREIDARARAIAIEQSVEMPPHAIRSPRVREHVVGRVEHVVADGPSHHLVTLSLALETTGYEAGQLMNMLFGNSSLHADVTLIDVHLPSEALARFGGPRFGIEGLRRMTGAGRRPLTCTALKPQGSTVAELATLAGEFAAGGIDLIKDDHGIADQHSAPFAERVEAVQEAVHNANHATGGRTVYAPSLNGGPQRLLAQLQTAKRIGVGAIMLAPMLSGMATLQELAREGLPILAHPALAGSPRIAPPLLIGKLFRLAGADAVIYPNFGGRFSFSRELCRSIAAAARKPWHDIAPAMPVPAGGIVPDRVEELVDFYGADVMLLIGGALLEAEDLGAAARAFVARVKAQELDA